MSSRARDAALRLLAMSDAAIVELCEDFGIDLLTVFGSAIEEAEPGDVDLAVSARGDLDVLGLLQRLYEITGFEGFDILDLRRSSAVAREHALVGARLLGEARPGLFANAQIAAIMERMDTDEMRRVELELMSR